MPLTVLMNYFNEQLQLNARTRSLPETGFYKASDMFGARFGSLTFASYFSKILGPDGRHVIGYHSETLVRSATGKTLEVDDVYSSLVDPYHVIQLDRLVRTLHSLNYLQRFNGDGILSVKVHPRHISSISSNYGKVFEAILSDCGLAPERVLLHTRLQDEVSLPHFRQAFLGYSELGYQIGVDVYEPSDLDLLGKLGLDPQVVFLHVPDREPSIYDKSAWLPPLNSLKRTRRAKHFLVVSEDESDFAQLNDFDGSLVRFRQSSHFLNV
jgi:hypothetical protein